MPALNPAKYSREHYLRNRDSLIQKASLKRKEYTTRNKEYTNEYLKNHPCIDCGETDIRFLQFDHKIKEEKYKDVSRLVSSGYALKSVINEITKCDIRCLNCHRKRTSIQNTGLKTRTM